MTLYDISIAKEWHSTLCEECHSFSFKYIVPLAYSEKVYMVNE